VLHCFKYGNVCVKNISGRTLLLYRLCVKEYFLVCELKHCEAVC